MQQPTRLISTPFAQEGEKTEIQNVTGEFDNSATYRLGFPPLTMQSIRSGGKPPKGTDFNGILFDITENISFLCKGGRYQYNSGLSTLIGGYPEGSNLLLDDNVTEVVSTVAGNQNNPNTNMTGWILKPNKTTAVNVTDASGETQQQVNYNGGAKWHSRVDGYLKNERVVLTNGDIVKSTVANNVIDPNVDMTGWMTDDNTVESIADLLAIPNPKNGSRVYVKSYHAGWAVENPYIGPRGGGTFVYSSEKSTINNGVITFNGWVRQYEIITSTMVGCKVDGVTNDREALQRGVDVTSARNIPLYLDEGIHLMADATFERWGTENPYQARCYIVDLRTNTYVRGLSENSVIKYGDGIVYTGYDLAGYKGAQLFCPSQLVPISNITLEGFTVDGNGYNNKNRVLNPAGNTGNSQALVLALGRKARVKDCVFKDMPGCQVIYSRDNFKDVVISGNTFIDSGWLDGTNWLPDYTDQSTIFLSGTYKCYNNQLVQNYAGMFAGTAFELHGKGDVTGNTVVGYANAFLSVGMYYDAHNRIIGNDVYNCNSLAYTDTHNVSFKNTMKVLSNTFFQRTSYISESLPFGRLRTVIGITGFNTTEGAKVIVKGNSITVDGVYDQRTDENLAKYNSVVYAQVPKHIEFSENTVIGVKGSIFRFGAQLISEDTSVIHVNNTYINCGIPSSTHLGNSLFYSDNDGRLDYGVKLKSLYSANNTYKNCHFKRILTAGVEAAGLLFPEKFESSNEVFTGTLPYTMGSVSGDATSTSSFLFDVKSINPVGNSTVIEDHPHDAFKCYNQWGKFTVLKDKAMPVVYVKNGTKQNWSVQV